MKRIGPQRFCFFIVLLFGIIGGANPPEARAQPSCLLPINVPPSSVAGQHCGGDPQADAADGRGLSVDLNATCRATVGATAVAALLTGRTDAYAWVCRMSGRPDASINLKQACQRANGSQAIATLAGIGADDWRCLRPEDIGAHVVPVLLFPQDKMFDANEAAFVTASLQRVSTLMGGVRQFYRERTSAFVRGTNSFVLLTSTAAADWQNLALCTDQAACTAIGNPFPFARDGYANRIMQETNAGGWKTLTDNSSGIIGAFVSLGASPPQPATWCGALDFIGQKFFVTAPSNSYAACSATTDNPPAYENAFYGTGHEFGHSLGLRHTNDSACPDPQSYVFNDVNPSSNLLPPGNPNNPIGSNFPAGSTFNNSIMCLGNGTASVLFPFEASAASVFLLGFH